VSWQAAQPADHRLPFDPRAPFFKYAWSNAVAISTTTPLLAFTELGLRHRDVRPLLKNLGSVDAYLVIDRSEDGVVPDTDPVIIRVPAGKQGSYEFRDVLANYFALSAYTDPDAGNPAGSVSWAMVARLR
jgi:hypothetical protein